MRFLSGVRPTNVLHVGNYFGALRQFIRFQQEHEGLVMIADLHALDTEQSPADLRNNILRLTATYLACGLDAKKNIVFQQSSVPEHTELSWVFSTLMRMSELERMTQYKDKAKTRGENVPVALFTYPVLMAADILLYHPHIVPVGEDQGQHVEFARDIAERFHRVYGEVFTLPKTSLRPASMRIMGLDDPSKKMSKSAPSAKNYIALTDGDDVIVKKIGSAVTGSSSAFPSTVDELEPGVRNLLNLYVLAVADATQQEEAEVEAHAVEQFAGKGYKTFKDATSEALIACIAPIRDRIAAHLAHPDELLATLRSGTDRARPLAHATMDKVTAAVGLQ
jgi:tryptophanyl-tRNA synthetase